MNANSIVALSFFNGKYVDFETSQTYLKRTSSVYDSVVATRYRILAGSLRNEEMSASIVEITTIVDPVGEAIVPFILSARKILLDPTVTLSVPTFSLSPYLYGGYCSTYDIQVSKDTLTESKYANTIFQEFFSHSSHCFTSRVGHHVQLISSYDWFDNCRCDFHHWCELRKCPPPCSPTSNRGYQFMLDLWTDGMFEEWNLILFFLPPV